MKQHVVYFLCATLLAIGCSSESNRSSSNDTSKVSAGDMSSPMGGIGMGGRIADDVDSGAELVGQGAVSTGGSPSGAMARAHELDQPGPFAIGFWEGETAYDSPLGDQRSLRVLAWFPIAQKGEPVDATFVAGLYTRQGVYFRGQPPADQTFPVMIFSHGSRGIAEQSFFLTEHFASHGWIVVAPDHTGNTILPPQEPLGPFSYLRPQDISATLDYLDTLTDEHPLFDHIGEPKIVAGHSYGGYTALALAGAVYDTSSLDACATDQDLLGICQSDAGRFFVDGFRDDRLSAAVAMTPPAIESYLSGMGTLGEISIPTLVITAGKDKTLVPSIHGEPVWQSLSQGASPEQKSIRLRLEFPEAGHFSFANLCETLPAEFIPPMVSSDGCAEEFTPSSEVHIVSKGFSLAFVLAHLLGDEKAREYLTDTTRLKDIAEVITVE